MLDTLMSCFQQIYGSDTYLEPDSKDGQMVALVALAIHDANSTATFAYNYFFPATGYDAALTSNMKINGIAREGTTGSTMDLVLAGTIGTTIMNGIVRDTSNVIWRLPASVVIGIDGTMTVTATCSNNRAVATLTGTITTINTSARGWTSMINPAAATVGASAETDAELRIRQGQSVALPSVTPFEGVDGAIVNAAGAVHHKPYENDVGATDGNGPPPHSISATVGDGDVADIAQATRSNKGQGTTTYGTTSVTMPDIYGDLHVISFSRSTDALIFGHITLKTFTGYTSQVGVQIQQAVAGYINGLTIGDSVLLSRIYSPANPDVVSGSSVRYYDIRELLVGKSAGTVTATNINIAYNGPASCKPEDIVLMVTS